MNGRGSVGSRDAYTLVELVAAMIGAAVLMAGITSSLFTAMRASNPENTPAASVLEGAACIADIAAELQFAQSLSLAQLTLVEAVVPDRNGDGNSEIIRYSWAGNKGPLVRTYNGVPTNAFASVELFNVEYYPVGAPKCVTVRMQRTENAATSVETTFAMLNLP